MSYTILCDDQTYRMDVQDAILHSKGEFSGNLDLQLTFSENIPVDQVLQNFRIRIRTGADSELIDIAGYEGENNSFNLTLFTGLDSLPPNLVEVFWLSHSETRALGNIDVSLARDKHAGELSATGPIPNRSDERVEISGGNNHFPAGPALLIFALLLFAAGLYFGDLTLRSVKLGLASNDWTETQGILLNAKLPVEYSGDIDKGYNRWYELSYAYSAVGSDDKIAHHRNSELDVLSSPKSRGNFLGMNTLIALLRESAPSIKVYYNPSHPEQSVIWKGVPYRSVSYAVITSVLLCSSLLPLGYPIKDATINNQQLSTSSTILLAMVSYGLLGLAYIALTYTLFPFLRPHIAPLLLTLFFPILCTSTLIVPLLGRSVFLSPLKTFLTSVTPLAFLAVLALSVFGFVRDVWFVHDESLEEYQLRPAQLSEMLASENTKALSWAGYRIARMEDPPDSAKNQLLKLTSNADSQVRKTAVFALTKYSDFSEQELAQVFSQLPDKDDKITLNKVLFLMRHHYYPKDKVLSLTKPMLEGTDTQRKSAFRYLRGLKTDASPLAKEILKSIKELDLGATMSLGIGVLGVLDKPADGITPLLLKILDGDNPGSQISALNYLK
ncbi:MAG: DUF3592 domain-containing protein, partial [Verrucomicrobia bacterium]|nr:DUF3592 domain-containing protein [Verrucomicrobiota bacterium]